MCLPYSKYHGSSASHQAPAGSILAPFWLHLGTLLDTLGAQRLPERLEKCLPKTHAKTTPKIMAKGHQNDLQNGLSNFGLGIFFGLIGCILAPDGSWDPFWDHFSQNWDYFLPIPTYFRSFSDSFLEAISTVNWTW